MEMLNVITNCLVPKNFYANMLGLTHGMPQFLYNTALQNKRKTTKKPFEMIYPFRLQATWHVAVTMWNYVISVCDFLLNKSLH